MANSSAQGHGPSAVGDSSSAVGDSSSAVGDSSSAVGGKVRSDPAKGGTRVLFLAQLPPPVHGVTSMSKLVHETLLDVPNVTLHHHFAGGARQMSDVGKKDLRKFAGFAKLLLKLLRKRLAGRRYDLGYVTLAPHGDALTRDAMLIGAAKMLSPRTLVHLHTRGLQDILDGKTIYQRFIRAAIKDTELIAIADCIAEPARASGHFKAVHLLPNHVEDPGLAESTVPAASTSGDKLACGRLACGYIGNLDERKGALRFVDAVADLVAAGIDVDATIAGGPTKNLSLDDLRAYAQAKGVSDKLAVVGFIDGKAKAELLRRLDVMIYLSQHDLSPLVLLEAMAYGTLPIAFDTGGISELLSPEFSHHVLTGSDDAERYRHDIVTICDGYWRDRTALLRDGKKARRRYEENYSFALFARRLRAIVSPSSVCAEKDNTLPLAVATVLTQDVQEGNARGSRDATQPAAKPADSKAVA